METKLFNFCHTNVNEVDRNDYLAARGRHAWIPVNYGIGNAYIRKWNMSTDYLKLVPSPRVRPDIRLLCFCFFFFQGRLQSSRHTEYVLERIRKSGFAFNLQKFSCSMGWRTRSRFFPRGVFFLVFRVRHSKLVTVIYGITDVVHLWHGREKRGNLKKLLFQSETWVFYLGFC